MTSSSVLRLSNPAEWLTSVPFLLGFEPRDSVVVLALGGSDGKQVTATLRVDLGGPDDVDALAGAVLDPLRHNGAQALVVLIYRDADGPLDPADRSTGEGLVARLEEHYEVRTALAVLRDRYLALDECPDRRCCPPGGRPRPQPDERVRAELVFKGLTALDSREELEALVAPGDAAHLPRMQRLADQAHRALWERAADGGFDLLYAWARDVRERWAAALATPEEALDEALAAEMLAAMTYYPIRDALLIPADQHRAAAVRLLAELTRRAPQPYVAGPATLLGLVASIEGDGALAGIAFSRALDADPDYSFARMLAHGLAHGVRMPQDFMTRCPDPISADALTSRSPGRRAAPKRRQPRARPRRSR